MSRVSITAGALVCLMLAGIVSLPGGRSGEGRASVFAVVCAQAAAAGEGVFEAGVPPGMEETYRLGLHPLESRVPVMYTIHPCPHCVHLKEFLDRNRVRHVQVYVDDFEGPAREALMESLRSWNSRGSFPTLVTPDGRSVAGFREKAVKRLLGLP